MDEFERLAEVLAEEEDSDLWLGGVNQLRVLAGLPTRGHGLTYDFMVAQRSVAKYNADWHCN